MRDRAGSRRTRQDRRSYCWIRGASPHETDLFLREHTDAVVICAAGNDGADLDGNRRIDDGGIYAPASAKNTIAVGAPPAMTATRAPGWPTAAGR